MRPAILAGAMKIPVARINAKLVEKHTTYLYRPMGAEDDIEVKAFFYDGDFICVPRQYGLALCNKLGIEWEDHTSSGVPVSFPKVPVPREYQIQTLDDIVQACDNYYDFLFRAHTGWGKTIGALIVAARLGVSTLIIVDQDNLADQWVERLTDPSLFGLNPEDIGRIQGKKCDYEGKPVTIAMVQTLAQKKFDEEVYRYHGLVISDEVHTIGAPTFSQVLTQFAATWRIGISATPKRRDGLQKALDHNLGKVRVAADKEHKESAVYMIYHDTVYSWYGNVSPKVGRILTEIADDGFRNLKLADAVVWLYETGRDVLVLGDRIEQLKELGCLLKYMGVEEDRIGLYTGEDPVFRLTKDPRPARRPKGYVRDTEYTPLKYERVRKKVPKARLKQVLRESKIILATYGMFQKGVDEPMLAGGADATPRGTSEQQMGRIQREVAGKHMPIWVTIVDRQNYRLLNSFLGRAQEYVKNNSRLFEWGEDGGLTECEPKRLFAEIRNRINELKAMRIETNSDGINMLTTAPCAKTKGQKHETDIREWAKRLSRQRSEGEAREGKSPSKVRRGPPPSKPSASPRLRRR